MKELVLAAATEALESGVDLSRCVAFFDGTRCWIELVDTLTGRIPEDAVGCIQELLAVPNVLPILQANGPVCTILAMQYAPPARKGNKS